MPSKVPSVKAIVHICDDALEQKRELDNYVTEISKRPFVTEIDATLSALYRSKLADIKKTMDGLLFGLSKVARGEILSVNPNLTNATKINPNLGKLLTFYQKLTISVKLMTMMVIFRVMLMVTVKDTNSYLSIPCLGMTVEGALRDNCPWSTMFKEQRSSESAARANVHGFVKTFFKCTILNGLEDEELKRIFMRAWQAYGPAVETIEELHPSFILKMALIALSYLHRKIKLFIKDIIIPNYAKHDLTLQFARDCWTVDIVGYVYSEEFRQINCEIAANPQPVLSKDVVHRIVEKQGLLPTVTVDWEELSCRYKIDELRAKKIIATVKR